MSEERLASGKPVSEKCRIHVYLTGPLNQMITAYVIEVVSAGFSLLKVTTESSTH